MKKIASLIAAGSLALTLSACGGAPEVNETSVETNVSEIETINEAVINDIAPLPEPSASPTAVPAPTGAEFDTTTTQEDADATGMTSRVDRGGNESAPTQ